MEKSSPNPETLGDNQTQGNGSSNPSFQLEDLAIEDEGNEDTTKNTGLFSSKVKNKRKRGKRDLPPEFFSNQSAISETSEDVSVTSTTQLTDSSDKQTSEDVMPKEQQIMQHTLEMFSIDHFRPPKKRTITNSLRGMPKDRPWSHSKRKIKQPLLKKLVDNPDLAEKACAAFKSIMIYMGDLHTNERYIHSVGWTDEIFTIALSNESLKDEIYCQLIKQLTNNKHQTSEDCGWELLWLAAGIFVCSQTLMPEVTKFLQTSRHDLAKDCLERLETTIKFGQRKCPPHLVEVEAIQRKTSQIYHKVYFPNDSDEIFEVHSGLKASDFCHIIGKKLHLKSLEGFRLFLKTGNEVTSIPEEEFFFDYLRTFAIAISKTMDNEEGMSASSPNHKDSLPTRHYQLFFMKKLWLNTVPGEDPRADTIFHYPQEFCKFHRGHHKCSKDEAAELAALHYRERFAEDTSEFQNIQSMLENLLPADLLQAVSPEVWKKSIVSAYKKHTGMSADETKIAFLKILHRLPTFGSAFFEVKQNAVSNYPSELLVAINKLGMILIDLRKKDILTTFPFTEISSWSSGDTHFTINIGNQVSSPSLTLETSMANTMDDLMTSYYREVTMDTKSQAETGHPAKSASTK